MRVNMRDTSYIILTPTLNPKLLNMFYIMSKPSDTHPEPETPKYILYHVETLHPKP